ncbi:DUF2291 family protein [Novosphingobium sp. FSY-8]|uniref:DUF2291 family protein n=1 Tax=Novosphingobium ovatum TaxID=1908523 RepID=A0ABW9XBE0_9SPHN|nr:DUF2291 family protein [Novosphingobium ovatum]NBC35822.1 DUF2291 family protein [Novosphingobium ovatum]
MSGKKRRVWHGLRCAVLVAGVGLLGGCKILTIEEDRARKAQVGGTFDAAAQVDAAWAAKVLPALQAAAVPLRDVQAQAAAGTLDAYGAAHGRRGMDDAPYSFAVTGEGQVVSIDRVNPNGVMVLRVDGVGDVRLMLGPVLLSTAVRDAVPMFDFNSLPDQMAYGAVARAMNLRAMAGIAPALQGVVPGARVSFTGAVQASGDQGAWQVVPVQLARARGGA